MSPTKARSPDGAPPGSRLGPLAHLVCELAGDPARLGRTRLCRTLWLADAEAFRRSGRTLSGVSVYVMEQHAPAPKGLAKALAGLEAEGALRIEKETRFGAPKPRIRSLRAPDESTFAPEGLEIVRQALEEALSPCSEAGSLRHRALWDAVGPGEEIPVSAVLATRAAPITPEDERWADAMIKEIHAGRAKAP